MKNRKLALYKLLGCLSLSSAIVMGCNKPLYDPQKVESGVYENYTIMQVVDKYSERDGEKWVIRVSDGVESATKPVSPEEFERAEIGDAAYVNTFMTVPAEVVIPRN